VGKADVSNVSDVNKMLENAKATFGSVQLLVNNAGVQVEKTLAESTDDDWDLVVGVNCRAVFNMSRGCLPGMQQNGGNIINTGSISGKVSDPSIALYNASQAFVHGLTRSIAVDHGPRVRCNASQPGWIMTAMAGNAFAMAKNLEVSRQDALARHPVGRFGKPEDIADLVSFLASEQSHYLSGECITVDGGLTAVSPLRSGLF
jgi:NAD(P)-dependent dehydrogenase (short-subunit alcohol dehydrogenase family)